MRTSILGIACVLLAASAPARADDLSLAVGVNAPYRWVDGDAVGISVSVGTAKHHAIRANFATHDYVGSSFGEWVGLVVSGAESDGPGVNGRVTDIGAGYVYYPRRLWDGFMLELGLMHRTRDISEDRHGGDELTYSKTTTRAARAMIGWSWLMYRRVFVAIGAGASLGSERGTELIVHDPPGSVGTTTSSMRTVDHTRAAAEAYFRIGGTFGN
jgi:hypothetical protein